MTDEQASDEGRPDDAEERGATDDRPAAAVADADRTDGPAGGAGEGDATGDAGEDAAPGDGTGPGRATRVRTYLLYATLAGLVLLAAIGVVNFYLAANGAIRQWVAPEFRQPFRAAFNLVVVLLSAAGAFAILRRL